MAGDLDLDARINIAQILAALRSIDANIDRMARNADRGFGDAGRAARASGAQMGAVAGVVASVTTAFIDLGKQAISALVEIGKQGVQTALEMDTLRARLLGIFDGSQEAATEAFGFIQAKSRELGIDLTELAGAFLPKTESLAQFERVAKIATALARSDPEQGAIGARIALIEALSGTFTSIQRRFEIPKEDINRIKEAFDKEGIEGFLTTLETVLEESGKSFDDLANTAQTSFNKLAITGEQLGGRLGVPIVESLEAAANKLNEFVAANEEDLIVFADTIGRAIADVIDFIASVDLSQLDTEQLIEFADYIFRVVNATQLAATQLAGFVSSVYQVVDAISPLGESLDALYYLLTNLDDALVTLSQILAISKAGYEGLFAGIQPLLPLLENLFTALSKAQARDYLGAAAAIGESIEALKTATFDSAAAQDAINASMAESAQAFDDYRSDVDGNTTAQDELRQSLEDTANAGTDAADAILAAAAADREKEEAAEKLKEAQDKVNKALAEAQKDFERKLDDIEIAAERKRFDIALDFANKREDAARNHLQKLVDIRRKNQQDITDAGTDLERKEEDIARKFADERIDLERDERQKRLDVETSFREKLEDIQKQSAFDLEEAERNRDAVGFLRILRQRNEQVQEAQVDRQREIDELRVNGERRKEELRIQQQRELEEAAIANERKLEDLRLNLERQLEEQNTAYSRQLEDLRINEERKFEEADRARERDIEDAKLAYERKLEDLRASLADELAILAAGNAALEAEQARHNAAMESNRASSPRDSEGGTRPSRTGGAAAGFGENPSTLSGPAPRRNRQRGVPRRRQHGGPVVEGGAFIVGEVGPELFVPDENGRILSAQKLASVAGGGSKIAPSNSLVMPNMSSSSVVSNVDSSRQVQVNMPPLDVGGLVSNPIFRAQLQNTVISMLRDAF